MNVLYKIFRTSFFVFLDVSGILLGIFLITLGLTVIIGWHVVGWMGWLLFIIGVCAFFLHIGHYFNFPYMRWLFGSSYFIQKSRGEEE